MIIDLDFLLDQLIILQSHTSHLIVDIVGNIARFLIKHLFSEEFKNNF